MKPQSEQHADGGRVSSATRRALDSRLGVPEVAYPVLRERLETARQIVDLSQVPVPDPTVAKARST